MLTHAMPVMGAGPIRSTRWRMLRSEPGQQASHAACGRGRLNSYASQPRAECVNGLAKVTGVSAATAPVSAAGTGQ